VKKRLNSINFFVRDLKFMFFLVALVSDTKLLDGSDLLLVLKKMF